LRRLRSHSFSAVVMPVKRLYRCARMHSGWSISRKGFGTPPTRAAESA